MYNRIPAAAADKAAVESGIGQALRSVPGTWAVEVRSAHEGDRWLVSLRRSGGITIQVSLVSGDTSSAAVYDKVRDALRKERLAG
jgi:hypothetical protein